jgi:hypothetical protein
MRGACGFIPTWVVLVAACGGQPFSPDDSKLDASSSSVPDTVSPPDAAASRDDAASHEAASSRDAVSNPDLTSGADATSTADTARDGDEASIDLAEASVADIRTIDVPAPSVSPAVTTQLLVWLRGDVGVTQLNDGVFNWADSSGNQLDAHQPDPTIEPLWMQAGVASRPAVMFNDPSFLSLPQGFADFSLGLSMFAIIAVADTADSCVDLVHLSNGPLLDNITLGRHAGRAHYQVLGTELNGDLLTAGRAHLISVVHTASRAVSLRIDAAAPTAAVFALPASTARASNVVGRSLYAGCGSLQGGIAEFLLYRRALSDFERAQVESYLQDRWGCCR